MRQHMCHRVVSLLLHNVFVQLLFAPSGNDLVENNTIETLMDGSNGDSGFDVFLKRNRTD